MGKAAVDLPDPLQASPDVGKPLTSTDDLLAQLAGDEIDRLLAEVDDTPAASPAVLPAAPTPAPGPAAAHPHAVATPASAPHHADPIIDEAEAASVLERDAADLTAELDALFESAKARSMLAEPGSADRPAADTAAPAAVAEELFETGSAERAGLAEATAPSASHAPSAAPTPAPKAAAPAVERRVETKPAPAEAAPLPAFLRPLEWINAPLENCPPPVRDFVGKAAIITLANAAAILVYVLLFRRG